MPKEDNKLSKKISLIDYQREKYYRRFYLIISNEGIALFLLFVIEEKYGAIQGTRTHDLLFTKQLLYQLS